MMILEAALPMKVGRLRFRTDGALLLNLLRGRRIGQTAPELIRTLDALDDFWARIGDEVQRYFLRLYCAYAWLELENADRARIELDRAMALSPKAPTTFFPLQSLIASKIAEAQGQFETCNAAMALAEEGFKASKIEAGNGYIQVHRAIQKASTGQWKETVAALDQLASDQSYVSEPQWSFTLLAARAEMHLRAGTELAGTLLAEYEKIHGHSFSTSLGLRIYKAAAQFYAQQGERAKSALYFDKAFEAARAICRILNPRDHQDFLDHQTGLIEAYKSFIREDGKDLQREDILQLLKPTNAEEEARQAARLKRAAGRFRIGFLITLGNAALLGAIFLGMWQG